MPVRRLLAALLLLLASSSLARAATWYESYREGISALQRQDWEAAVRAFTEAIQENPDPELWARTRGSDRLNYYPYLQLGIAYFNLQEYAKAVNAFDTEESFRVITRSKTDYRNLRTLRDRAREEVKKAAAGVDSGPVYSFTETIQTQDTEGKEGSVQVKYYISGQELAAKSLALARAREDEGNLEGAVRVLGPGLAVDPDNPELADTLARLRGKILAAERARADKERVENAVGEGRRMMQAGRYEAASSALLQALSVDPGNEAAKTLLADSQARLSRQMEAERTTEALRRQVAEGLDEAIRFETAGRPGDAIERLQGVLALDPGNARAIEMQGRLVKQRGQAEEEAARRREAARLLDEGVGLFKAHDFENAVSAFNRLIALDPENLAGRTYLGQSFAAMSAELLATPAPAKAPALPPVMALANAAAGALGGPMQENVTSEEFVLAGVIVDDQPGLELRFVSGGGSDEPPRGFSPAGQAMGNLYRYDFSQTFRLRSGLSEFRIVATDSDGLSAEIRHRVVYTPPFWRSSWFYTAIALTLVATAGSVGGLRAYRRQRLLSRRFNPYVAGAPVLSEDLFMGREQLLSRILQTVHNNSILLFGERRIGKTSLQHHLRRRLRQIRDTEYEFFPVYIDLQGTPQERFFATLAEETFEELGPLLPDVRPDPRLADADAYGYDLFVRDIRNLLKALARRSEKKAKLVLLIDEVDELNDYDPKVNQKLRSLFMKSFAEHMVAVVSGVGIKKNWASEGSPWYNFFEEIEVRPFAREDAAELIERPIRGVFQIEEGVVDSIIRKTDCKPYLIQKLCIALVNRLHEQGRRRITLQDVESVGLPVEG